MGSKLSYLPAYQRRNRIEPLASDIRRVDYNSPPELVIDLSDTPYFQDDEFQILDEDQIEPEHPVRKVLVKVEGKLFVSSASAFKMEADVSKDRWFFIGQNEFMFKLKQEYARLMECNVDDIRFEFDGKELRHFDTPLGLGMDKYKMVLVEAYFEPEVPLTDGEKGLVNIEIE